MRKILCRGFIALLVFTMAVSLCACKENATPSYEGTAQELEILLNDISTIPVGTMGVSGIITSKAVDLLNWCAVTSMDTASFEQVVKTKYEAMEPTDQIVFIEQCVSVADAIQALSDETIRPQMLESAGLSDNNTWDVAVFEYAAAIGEFLRIKS